jgi:hypothetical protein
MDTCNRPRREPRPAPSTRAPQGRSVR